MAGLSSSVDGNWPGAPDCVSLAAGPRWDRTRPATRPASDASEILAAGVAKNGTAGYSLAMPEAPALEHLFTLTATLREKPPALISAPQGSRVIVTVTGGHFEGPKLRGLVDNSGGDWVSLRADGSIKFDVRILLHTDDGADILTRYEGVGVRIDGVLKVVTAPLFETGDTRYAWLNNLQAIGHGASSGDRVTYEVFAVQP